MTKHINIDETDCVFCEIVAKMDETKVTEVLSKRQYYTLTNSIISKGYKDESN